MPEQVLSMHLLFADAEHEVRETTAAPLR